MVGRTPARREEGQPWTATAWCLMLLARLRGGPGRPAGPPGRGAASAPTPLGARRPAVLRGRGRAVHQRHDRRRWAPTSGRTWGRRRAPARRAARGRRLELRGGERLRALVVPHDDQRPGGTAGVRARDRRRPRRSGRPGGGARSTCSSGGCSGARAPARSSTRPSCSSRSRPAGTTTCCAASSTSASTGDRAGPAAGRGDRPGPLQAAARRHLAAGEHATGAGPLRAGGRRRPPEPLEHPARAPRAPLGRPEGCRSCLTFAGIGALSGWIDIGSGCARCRP